MIIDKSLKFQKVYLEHKCDIIDKFNSINAMIEQNKNENARLVQLRDTLLPKLMKGEIEL